jgi:hypothetical protein
MNRHSLVVMILAGLAGCVDQQAPVETGNSEQDLAVSTLPTVYPQLWDPRTDNQIRDFWDLNQGGIVGNFAHQMVAVRTNGEPEIPCVNFGSTCAGGQPATKMVWLISNTRVFRVYEINVGELGLFNAYMNAAFKTFEATKIGTVPDVGDGGVGGDYGPAPGGGVHIGPPRGFPLALVNDMRSYAASVRTVMANVPSVEGVLLPPVTAP